MDEKEGIKQDDEKEGKEKDSGEEENFEERGLEIAEKYNIDLEKLKKEQLKLKENLKIKDSMNFDLVERIAGIDNAFFKNQIISAIVVLVDGEVVEQEYFSDKIRFPYISGFRAYRELPSMIQAFNKLDEKPDLVFIRGNGILHPRGFGLASHFSVSTSVPTIGVTDSLLVGEIEEDSIFLDVNLVGKIIKTKEGAKSLYVSPGNMISVSTAAKLVKKFTLEPHKFPEPLRLAKKYAKEIRKEIFTS